RSSPKNLCRPLHGVLPLFDIHATPPMRGPAGLRHQTPIRTPGSGRSDACTTHAKAGSIDLLQTPDRRSPMERSETPGPTRHTTDTPICQASTLHRRYIDVSIQSYAHAFAPPAEAALPNHPQANP